MSVRALLFMIHAERMAELMDDTSSLAQIVTPP
jgi:hypothetical protein